jgi:hypothetical protein
MASRRQSRGKLAFFAHFANLANNTIIISVNKKNIYTFLFCPFYRLNRQNSPLTKKTEIKKRVKSTTKKFFSFF